MDRTSRTVVRIVVIGPVPPPLNGVTVMTGHVLSSLGSANKWQVFHLDTSDHRGIANVGRFDARNVLIALRHAFAALVMFGRIRPSLVCIPISQGTWGILRDVLFFAAARAMGARVVIHFHGAEFREFYEGCSGSMKRVLQWCFRGSVAAIVLSHGSRANIEAIYPWNAIHVVPNGIPAIEEVVVPTNGHCRVLYVSKIAMRKGYRDLLGAAAEVWKEVPGVEFVFAGDWESATDSVTAREFARQCDHPELIRFVGIVDGREKAQIYRSADLFVFPPRQPEGQGIVVLEAMSAGLPIVATAIGAMREVVCDGETGLLVPPCDPSALAHGIVKLLKDEGLRVKMGRAGRDEYLRRYTVGHFRDELVKAFSVHANYGEPAGETLMSAGEVS